MVLCVYSKMLEIMKFWWFSFLIVVSGRCGQCAKLGFVVEL